MIEAMVLEISSQALDEQVQWDLNPDRTGDGNFIKQKLDGSNNSLVFGRIAQICLFSTIGCYCYKRVS